MYCDGGCMMQGDLNQGILTISRGFIKNFVKVIDFDAVRRMLMRIK